jgi:ABC-type molybdate transport system substrate-binding protein
MLKKIGVAFVLLLGLCLVLLVSGCGGDGGGDYDMASDEEFQAALDEAANKVSEGGSSTEAYEELAAAFSDRYAAEDILDALQAKLSEVRDQIVEEKEAILEGEWEEEE